MPKTLYYKLSDDKKKRIISAAREEFIKHKFEDVSINAVVKKAKISRGGFYLYFADKEDLYYCLIDEATVILLNKLKDIMRVCKDAFEVCDKAFDFYIGKGASDYLFLRSAMEGLNERVKEYIVNKLTQNEVLHWNVKKDIDEEMSKAFRQLIISTFLTSLSRAFKNNNPQEEKKILLNKLHIIKCGFDNL